MNGVCNNKLKFISGDAKAAEAAQSSAFYSPSDPNTLYANATAPPPSYEQTVGNDKKDN